MPASPGDRFMRMPARADGESLLSGAAKRLSRIKIPFKSPSLLDRSAPYFSGIKRFGISKFQHYWQDPFHTLLNLPWGRFIVIFFATYVIEFMVFAFIFWAQSDNCIHGMEGKFSHALWMSSRTASTLGYDQIAPNPECTFTNITVMLQVIASSLVNFIMLGLVFARFSAPFKRASTIRFSGVMVCYQHPSGFWCLSLRVANIRKHQILKPSVRMVLTAVDSITPSNYLFEHLAIEGHSTQETNLELGFPANVTHIITPSSPLYNLSLLEMDTRMMEILVFVDGIDAMTSKNMSARHAYNTNEVHMNEVFQPLHLEMRGGSLGLDFSGFDATALASVQLLSDYNADPSLAERPLPEVQSHMWHLRHMTFKRLTEREPGQANGSAVLPASSQSSDGGAGAAHPASSYRPPPPASAPPSAHPWSDGPLLPSVASSNPFHHPSGGGGGGSGAVAAAGPTAPPSSSSPVTPGGPGANRNSGSGSTWMGFGVTLQPSATPTHGPVPISAFLNSQHSGLESFADKTPQPAGGFTSVALGGQQPGQRSWVAGGGTPPPPAPPPQAQGSTAALLAALPPQPQQQQQPLGSAVYSAGQTRGGMGSSGGAPVGLEMLPTSSAAVEPRVNGGAGLR